MIHVPTEREAGCCRLMLPALACRCPDPMPQRPASRTAARTQQARGSLKAQGKLSARRPARPSVRLSPRCWQSSMVANRAPQLSQQLTCD